MVQARGAASAYLPRRSGAGKAAGVYCRRQRGLPCRRCRAAGGQASHGGSGLESRGALWGPFDEMGGWGSAGFGPSCAGGTASLPGHAVRGREQSMEADGRGGRGSGRKGGGGLQQGPAFCFRAAWGVAPLGAAAWSVGMGAATAWRPGLSGGCQGPGVPSSKSNWDATTGPRQGKAGRVFPERDTWHSLWHVCTGCSGWHGPAAARPVGSVLRPFCRRGIAKQGK